MTAIWNHVKQGLPRRTCGGPIDAPSVRFIGLPLMENLVSLNA